MIGGQRGEPLLLGVQSLCTLGTPHAVDVAIMALAWWAEGSVKVARAPGHDQPLKAAAHLGALALRRPRPVERSDHRRLASVPLPLAAHEVVREQFPA